MVGKGEDTVKIHVGVVERLQPVMGGLGLPQRIHRFLCQHTGHLTAEAQTGTGASGKGSLRQGIQPQMPVGGTCPTGIGAVGDKGKGQLRQDEVGRLFGEHGIITARHVMADSQSGGEYGGEQMAGLPNASNYRFENSFINTADDGNENFVGVVYDSLGVEPFGKDHFRCIDNDNFIYDFHLSEQAKARGVASDRYAETLRFDIDGVERLPGAVDAGCYQYIELSEEE